MRNSVLAAVVALVIVVSGGFAAGAVPTQGSESLGAHSVGSPASPATAPVRSDPTYYSNLSADLLAAGDGGSVAALGALPLEVVQHFLQVNTDPTSTQSSVYSADNAAYNASSGLQLAFNWGALLGAAVAGCAAGAIVGGLAGSAAVLIGALPGAGIGCIAGATAGALGDYIGSLWNVASVSKETFQVADAQMANELRLVEGQAATENVLLPATQYFWYRLADVAAMQQIGNSTWNASLDLIQSTMVTQMASMQTALIADINEIFTEYAQFLSANGQSLTFYNIVNSVSSNVDAGVPLFGMTASNAWLYNGTAIDGIAEGGDRLTCSGNTLENASGATESFATFSGLHYTYGAGHMTIKSPTTTCTGDAITAGTGGTVQWTESISGTGALLSGLAPESSYAGYWGAGAPFCPTGTCTYSNDAGFVFPFLRDSGDGAQPLASGSGGSTSGLANSVFGMPDVTKVANTLAGLQVNAVASGETYWSYLRALGFTDPADIPARFQILPPAGAMADYVCIDNSSIYGGSGYNGTCLNLNYTEFNSLYLAWLQSLANYFNSTTYQQGPSPCATPMDCIAWGNLDIYGDGSVYIPGATSASGGTESFGNVSSWNVSKQQLLFFPEVNPVTIPTGSVWEVPSNVPLQVYVVGSGSFLSLTGNGTPIQESSSGSTLREFTNSSGDAIYLTTCTIDGVVSAGCPVRPYTVNATMTQLLCSANSSACPTPPPNGAGGFFSLPNLFCGLLGAFGIGCSGPLGAIASILMLLLVIAIVGVAIYVVYRVASGSRRGGDGASTIVLERR